MRAIVEIDAEDFRLRRPNAIWFNFGRIYDRRVEVSVGVRGFDRIVMRRLRGGAGLVKSMSSSSHS